MLMRLKKKNTVLPFVSNIYLVIYLITGHSECFLIRDKQLCFVWKRDFTAVINLTEGIRCP